MCRLYRTSGSRQIILFFFNDTATTEIYTLSLHDALPISVGVRVARAVLIGARHRKQVDRFREQRVGHLFERRDRKSTRLNSSHLVISYAVFCLKKKNKSDGYWSGIGNEPAQGPTVTTSYS